MGLQGFIRGFGVLGFRGLGLTRGLGVWGFGGLVVKWFGGPGVY